MKFFSPCQRLISISYSSPQSSWILAALSGNGNNIYWSTVPATNLDFLSSYIYLISRFHLWFSNSFFFPCNLKWPKENLITRFQMVGIDIWVKVSRTKFRTVLFYLSQVYIYFPKSEKIQTCPENSSIILSSLGELLFLAAILVLLCIFNQNISWDGINFSSFFLPLPQALHPNQKKRSCKKTVEREDRVIEANTAQIHLFSSGGKSNEFSIGGTKCLGNPERLDEVLEQGTKIFTPNICFYFLKQKKLQSSSTILF